MKRHLYVRVPTTSRPDHLLCPRCSSGELHQQGANPLLAKCNSCSCAFEGALLRTLKQIASLPDALGKHSCECGHPEMRRLPEEIFHCPACGSEVVHLEVGCGAS